MPDLKEMPKDLWRLKNFYSADRSVSEKSYTLMGSFIEDFDFPFLDYRLPPNALKGVDRTQLVALEATKEALADIGIEPGLMGFGTLTDCIHLINYSQVPTINLGPDIETAHMADEFVTVEQLIELTKALALTIMRWSGVKEAAR